eukprot:CAMPEP_0196719742 /NCGR_PEP_ID=MMETSP1091-20130531/2678_1 /TAXON_ID=302021 /ORGANISM="Rhodomonas sp., Strain CCMP768" /LENGTH=721 /DNA_ID=CAMNT_0042060781 /DNA_START=17 /DNA_END=2182 /DNA_ORIENTATION=-
MCTADSIHTHAPCTREVKEIRVQPGEGVIARVLASATAWSRIVLAPGLYTESSSILVSQSGLQIVAETKHASKIVAVMQSTEPLFRIESNDVLVSGVVIEDGRQLACEIQSACISIEQRCNVRVERCNVSAKYGTGIQVELGASPTIADCVVHDCISGIVVRGHSNATVSGTFVTKCRSSCITSLDAARGIFTNNMLFEAGDACIWAKGTSSPRFSNNKIGIGACGVICDDQTTAKLEENELTTPHTNGIQVGSDANPTVARNTIAESAGSGIVIFGRARGAFVGNSIAGCKLTCISVRDDAEPTVIGNTIRNGAGSGVVVVGRAGGVFQNNEVAGHACAGVAVAGEASGLYDGNTIKGNGVYGVLVQASGAGLFQANEIEGNPTGVAVGGTAGPTLHGNLIRDGASVGLLVQEQAGGEYRENKISGYTATNVLLDGACTALVRDNVISDGAGGGVLAKGACAATLRGNRIAGNGRANVALMEGANMRVEGNTIQHGKGRGVVCMGRARGVVLSNSVRSHACEGLLVTGEARPTVRGNLIGESAGPGIVLEERAGGEYADNVLQDNAEGGVKLNLQSKLKAGPAVHRNTVTETEEGRPGQSAGAGEHYVRIVNPASASAGPCNTVTVGCLLSPAAAPHVTSRRDASAEAPKQQPSQVDMPSHVGRGQATTLRKEGGTNMKCGPVAVASSSRAGPAMASGHVGVQAEVGLWHPREQLFAQVA